MNLGEFNSSEIKRDKEEDNHQPKVLNTDNKTNTQNSTSSNIMSTPPDRYFLILFIF